MSAVGVVGFQTSQRSVRRDLRPMAENALIDEGELVVSKGGFVALPTGAADEVPIGRACEWADNTGGANGARLVTVDFLRERSLVLVGNDGANPVTVAMREAPVSLKNGRTARAHVAGAKTNAIAYDVTDEGVWVEVVS